MATYMVDSIPLEVTRILFVLLSRVTFRVATHLNLDEPFSASSQARFEMKCSILFFCSLSPRGVALSFKKTLSPRGTWSQSGPVTSGSSPSIAASSSSLIIAAVKRAGSRSLLRPPPLRWPAKEVLPEYKISTVSTWANNISSTSNFA